MPKNNEILPNKPGKVNKNKLGNFYFEKMGEEYLLTNDNGGYIFLNHDSFAKYLTGDFDENDQIYWQLQELGMVKDNINFENIIEQYRTKNASLGAGPSLHILVVTLRCNHKCVYCHASAQHEDSTQYDMNEETARKAIDLIFKSTSKNIAIEFQGGEPLMNWPIIQFTTKYSKKLAELSGKDLQLRLITNLSLMTDEILDYCYNNEISISTSLDGPEELHNRNRIYVDDNSYQKASYWIKKATDLYKKGKDGKEMFLPGAILTTTKRSLEFSKEIVDEYVKQGFNSLFIKHINPFGFAAKDSANNHFTVEEFLDFYKKSMDYIIEINKNGYEMREMTSTIMLSKILFGEDPNYLELRSPCGAAIGQMAYNYNGDIYTCDEGRLLSMMNDETFKIGNVFEHQYEDLIDNNVVKSVCTSSCLDALPSCADCVFKPYCGTCPIYNYIVQGNIFGNMPNNDRCRINKEIFRYLFDKLKDEETKVVFYGWTIKN